MTEMVIGFVGSGHIGSTLARLAVQRGHRAVLSNSRGPATLADLVDGLGDGATAGTIDEAEAAGDVVVVTVPLESYAKVPAAPLVGKVVIDTCNYYPDRDGRFAELDDDSTTSSELVAAHFAGARVVKAFNSIRFDDLASDGSPAGTPGRRALPIAGDDDGAKTVVGGLVDEFGFDVLDVGPLREGRRFQPGTPSYTVRMTLGELQQALDRVGA